MKRIGFILAIICVTIGGSHGQNLDTMITAGQTSTFSGNVRGYYFVAPSDFVITKLFVPTDANSGNQSIAVMKMNEIVTFSSTTNNFDLLYLVQDTNELGWIEVAISVEAGDTIGILGYRSNVNSYLSNPPNVTIAGNSVTLTRLGMQNDLRTTSPQNLWTESSSINTNISRVFFEYCTGGGCNCPRLSSTTVTNASSATSSDGSISVDLSENNNTIRYLRWATKNGVNYPATNAEDVNGLAPGDYTLFIVTKDYEPCYLGPVTVGP